MINLIWHCNKENSWESDWLEYLFEDIPHNTITDYGQSLNLENDIIVYNSSVNMTSYLNRKQLVIGLIHLSDEWDKDPIDHYNHAKFVMRNYYKPLSPKVINFPLGWMTTFPKVINYKTIEEKRFVWSFTGHVDKTTRPEMAKWMSTVPTGKSFFKRCGENWGLFQGHALNPVQMADLYNDSIFVPCPQGNCSIDSFRVTEALQAGALPIVEKSDYWSNLFGPNPLIQVESWEQAPKLISTLLKNKTVLEQVRKDTLAWWMDHVQQLKVKIKKVINENS